MYDSNAEAGLVNLHTGQNETIRLDGPNVALSAEWATDGTLRYRSGEQQKPMILDPVTKQVRPQD